ncbi:C39 family peptidase [Kribbella sp. CA-247076]|uniref:C39 family peptidase n=1 Tax=Kribbella sp. CA-247076 TaxID=3239941 RepID=UPI003D8B7B9E
MPTAARGATLILLGALLAPLVTAPVTAAAYEPRDRTTPGPPTTAIPAPEPTTAERTAEPTAATEATVQPVARSWSELAKQVAETSPDDLQLRSADTSTRASSVLRCFRLEQENYCLGLGFVDQLPDGAQLQELMTPPSVHADSEAGVEQDIPTGALAPEAFVADRTSMPKSARVNAELDEMQAAWDGRDKARALRLLDATPTTSPGAPTDRTLSTRPSTAPATPTTAPTPTPTRTAPSQGTPTPVPAPVAPVKPPKSSYIMKGFQTSQEKGYWCGPATFQSIDWADDNQKDTQASWAKDLGTTTSGTAITAMVKQTNLKTNWDLAAGTYIVQSVGHWNAQKFFAVHQNHLGDGKPAPIIEHTQLLKRYFPYLAFNHSGHFQVGRGYDRTKGTIAIYEVFNERRFNSRGNITSGPKNIPATALFNATLANAFKNIGL